MKLKENELYYAAGAGLNFGLKLEIDVEESQYKSNNTQKGVKVLVHPNNAYPDLSLLSYLIENLYSVTLALSSAIVTSHADIKSIKQEQRSCLMANEVLNIHTDRFF